MLNLRRRCTSNVIHENLYSVITQQAGGLCKFRDSKENRGIERHWRS